MDKKLFLKFLLPTLAGIMFFLFPVQSGENRTILLAVITYVIRAPFNDFLLEIIVSVVLLSTIGSIYYMALKPDWKDSQPSLYISFHVTPMWLYLRILGSIFAISVYFQIGPEIIWGAETGLTVFTDIGAPIIFIVMVACFLMPFLTEFGFMEFIGTMVSRPFGYIFTLPGRSAIDAFASFLTSSTVGLLITIGQYEKGYYSAREACSVAANFSVVSISFSLLIATVAGIDHMFFSWYFSVFITCIICAVIMVRLPPLCNIENSYFPPSGKKSPVEKEPDKNILLRATQNAMKRAEHAPHPLEMIKFSWYGTISVIFGVLAPSMAIGTCTIILLTQTPVFNILSYPIYFLLELFSFPDAKIASAGFIIGFLDQFMPALVASGSENELVKFILAGLAVTQLIYMSEVGLVILRSSLPLKFRDLIIIFLLRSIISFPILLAAGLIMVK